MRKLERHQIKTLEDYWIKHNENIKQLKYRKWELLNVNTEPTKQPAAKLANDKLYQNLKIIIEVVEKLYNESDDDTKSIVNMRYWYTGGGFMEWNDIAYELGYSRSKALRTRNKLLVQTADLIGYV